jgi:LmbE family N-acetylglucosaminyl deacetylase
VKNLLRHFLGTLVALALRVRSQPLPAAAGPTLVVAPHADDETLGCGGLLAARAQPPGAVQVVFVTDSAGSPEARPAAGQAARRGQEALAALQVLGVPATAAHFLNAPDGRLNRLTPEETRQILASLERLLRTLQPADIFVPYRGGGSSEHDATTGLLRQALAATGLQARVWEYPVWAWWDARRLAGQWRRPRENFRLPLGELRDRKRRALACHASQCAPASPQADPDLPPVLAALCTGPVEFYFLRQP